MYDFQAEDPESVIFHRRPVEFGSEIDKPETVVLCVCAFTAQTPFGDCLIDKDKYAAVDGIAYTAISLLRRVECIRSAGAVFYCLLSG